MEKGKIKSKSSPSNWAHGGSGHMVGKTGAGTPHEAGTSGSAHGPASRGFVKGGSGHMLGKSGSKPAKPR